MTEEAGLTLFVDLITAPPNWDGGILQSFVSYQRYEVNLIADTVRLTGCKILQPLPHWIEDEKTRLHSTWPASSEKVA